MSIRNVVYLAWFLLAALVNFGCQNDPALQNGSQNEEQLDVMRDYGGERIDRRPTRSMP